MRGLSSGYLAKAGRDATFQRRGGGRRIQRDWLHDAKPCHVKPTVTCECRTPDAPAPGAAGTTRPPVVSPCDVSPDLGPVRFRRSRVRARSSPHRPRHATPATNSLSTRDSLQLLPRPARRETV